MQRLAGSGLAVIDEAGATGQVLIEGATQRDVEHLHAPADREEGQLGSHCCPCKGKLQTIARRVDSVDALMGLGAVEGRIDIAAADQDEPVEA